MNTPEMFFQAILYSFIVGSNIYMLLSGYLCLNKSFSKSFYYSGIKVIASYLFFSLLTIILGVYVFHNGITWKSGILGIFGFTTIPYAWYIEMWIGLYLLIPFLNIWYKSMPSRKMKKILIFFLFLLTAPTDFINRYGLYLWPGFWESTFPLMFYFMGCYVREYKPNIKRWKLLLILLALSLVGPVFNLIIQYPKYLSITGDRNGLFMISIALIIFLCFYNYNLTNNYAKKIFKAISLRSLDIFLCSATLDALIYPWFHEHYYVNQSQYFKWYFVIVPLVFICAYVIASFKRIVFNIIQYFLSLFNAPFSIQNKG